MSTQNFNWLYLRGDKVYTDERYRELTNECEGKEVITEEMLNTPEINSFFLSRAEDLPLAKAKLNKMYANHGLLGETNGTE